MFSFLRKWQYVGVVKGETYTVNPDGTRIPGSSQVGYWVLYEKEGRKEKRKAKPIGDPGKSAFASSRKVQVAAWLIGGPIPSDLEDAPATGILDEPGNAPEEHVEHEADNVVEFPGSKSK